MRDDRPKGRSSLVRAPCAGMRGGRAFGGSPYEGRVPIVTSVVFVLPFLM